MFIYISGSKKLYFNQFNKHSSKNFNIFLMPKQTSFVQSPLGLLEINATDGFITGVLFTRTLKNPLQPADDLQSEPITDPLIINCVRQLEEYFKGERIQFDLPFKQEGSAFQQKVWTALTGIPYGKTISYLELSRRIGNVKAIRAVGTTNGKNSISIIVPCHRVIGSNGDLTGYAGELWRKKWLLDHEARYAHGVQTLFP